LALRKGPKVEDVVIGFFVLLAFLYPLVATVLIGLEERKYRLSWADGLRITSFLVGGLEECTPDRAVQVAKLFERKALQELGGTEGLLKLCLENKEKLGNTVFLEGKVSQSGEVYLMELEVRGERGGIKVKVYGRMEDDELRITGVESYEEGG